MTDRFGWRSFWWLNVALYGATIAFQLFLHPETHYDRRNKPTEPSDSSITEMKPAAAVSEGINSPTKDNVDEHFGKGAPSRDQFLSVIKRATGKEVFLTFWIPIKLFSFPIVEWTSFALSWSAAVFLLTNLTQSQAFAAPPYNMSSTSVGAYLCHNYRRFEGPGGKRKMGITTFSLGLSLHETTKTDKSLGRINKLRHTHRRNHRYAYCRSPERLGLHEGHPTKQRDPRARDATTQPNTVCTLLSHRYPCHRVWIPEFVAVGGYRHHWIHAVRSSGERCSYI
jgi:hypothetical protein